MNVILASQSPRRRELLGLFRIPFTVRAADIDETMDPALPAEQEVARVSRAKAMATPAKAEDVVIAADTIVVCNGKTLGKPKSEAQAVEMLTMLSGRDHQDHPPPFPQAVSAGDPGLCGHRRTHGQGRGLRNPGGRSPFRGAP